MNVFSRAPLIVLAFTAAGVLPVPAAAQQEYRGPILMQLPASTRALGLGNAFPVGATDSDAVFYTAAFADRLRGAGAAFQTFNGSGSLLTASAGTEWWNGGLAIGVRALDYGRGMVIDRLPTGEADLLSAGSLSGERAATLAYGRRIKGVRLGAAGHLVQHRTSAEAVSLLLADISAGAVVGPVSGALAVRNIGGSYRLGGSVIEPPTMVTLSAATGSRAVGPLDITPAASATYRVDGDVIVGGGVELGYWPVQGRTFLLRLGARYGEADTWATAGAGFVGDRLILDYALVPYDGGDVSHRFGVRWQ